MATLGTRCRILPLLAALAVLPSCEDGIFGTDWDGSHDDRFEATASFSFSVPVATRTAISVDAVSGFIDLRTSPNTDVIEIVGRRIVGAESTAAQRRLNDLRVDVRESLDEVVVRTQQPSNSQGRRYEVEYQITVPERFHADLDQANGSVDVSGPLEDLDITNVNGVVTVAGTSRAVDVTVVNGNVVATLDQVGAGVSLATTNGGVTLRIPSTSSVRLAAQVVNGSISISGLTLTDQVISQRSLTGTIGDGRYSVDLTTVNGNVTIAAR